MKHWVVLQGTPQSRRGWRTIGLAAGGGRGRRRRHPSATQLLAQPSQQHCTCSRVRLLASWPLQKPANSGSAGRAGLAGPPWAWRLAHCGCSAMWAWLRGLAAAEWDAKGRADRRASGRAAQAIFAVVVRLRPRRTVCGPLRERDHVLKRCEAWQAHLIPPLQLVSCAPEPSIGHTNSVDSHGWRPRPPARAGCHLPLAALSSCRPPGSPQTVRTTPTRARHDTA